MTSPIDEKESEHIGTTESKDTRKPKGSSVMSDNSKRSSELHKGHRERMRKRFIANNGRDFSDHELLEMLLYFSVPRSDTNELAHKLLNEFGSLRAACNASPEKLERIKGIGPSTSFLFKLIFTIRKRMDIEKYKNKKLASDRISNVGNYLIDYYRDTPVEELCLMLLDNSLRLIDFIPFASGSVNSVSIDVRALAKTALDKDVSYVIIAHNHPAGTLNQSNEDKLITSQVQAALYTIGITLLDHIIVNDVAYMPTLMAQIKGRIPQADIDMINKFYWG